MKKYFFLICWCALIFYFSSLPSLRISEENITDLVFRKIAHITEFFVLYLLAFNVMRNKKYALIFSLIYAVSDEYHQTFVQGREGCVRDVLIDSIGIFAGYFFRDKILNFYYKYLPKSNISQT
jgi:VanZ family protein